MRGEIKVSPATSKCSLPYKVESSPRPQIMFAPKLPIILRFSNKLSRKLSDFVPPYAAPTKIDESDFVEFLKHYDNILVLTGAGVSTESGIPDYRSKGVGMFERTSYKPIQYAEFLKNPKARARYWARNFVGWPRFSTFRPNKAHFFLADLESVPGKLTGIITQNVDGLHSKAGSQNIVELHGNAFWVRCIKCGEYVNRYDFQKTLQEMNLHMNVTSEEIRPDGDVELDPEEIQKFMVPDCPKCGGILKPTIVFFGDNVPEKRVKVVEQLVEECDALLVIGTSLSTLSSYRIVDQAYDLAKFLCIVNIGPTRADKKADLLIQTNFNEIIPQIREP